MKKEDVDVWKKSLSIVSKIMLPGVALALVGDPLYAQGIATFTLEILGHAQSEVKLKRVESLLLGIEELLKKHDPNFEFKEATSQEVRDLLETAIINASKATSENKIDRLRKVIFGHIIDPQPFDYTSRYLDLGLRLNDNQIRILECYVDTEIELEPCRMELRKMHKIRQDSKEAEGKIFAATSQASVNTKKIFMFKMKKLKEDIEKAEFEFESLVNKRRRKIKEIPEDEFQFLFNDLRVLGLIYNPAEGRTSNTGDSAYYHCTALAKGFMRYLKNNE